jgi:hypothetical protein
MQGPDTSNILYIILLFNPTLFSHLGSSCKTSQEVVIDLDGLGSISVLIMIDRVGMQDSDFFSKAPNCYVIGI